MFILSLKKYCFKNISILKYFTKIYIMCFLAFDITIWDNNCKWSLNLQFFAFAGTKGVHLFSFYFLRSFFSMIKIGWLNTLLTEKIILYGYCWTMHTLVLFCSLKESHFWRYVRVYMCACICARVYVRVYMCDGECIDRCNYTLESLAIQGTCQKSNG